MLTGQPNPDNPQLSNWQLGLTITGDLLGYPNKSCFRDSLTCKCGSFGIHTLQFKDTELYFFIHNWMKLQPRTILPFMKTGILGIYRLNLDLPGWPWLPLVSAGSSKCHPHIHPSHVGVVRLHKVPPPTSTVPPQPGLSSTFDHWYVPGWLELPSAEASHDDCSSSKPYLLGTGPGYSPQPSNLYWAEPSLAELFWACHSEPIPQASWFCDLFYTAHTVSGSSLRSKVLPPYLGVSSHDHSWSVSSWARVWALGIPSLFEI